MLSLGVCFCAVWDCSSCLGDSGDPHQVVVVGATSGIRASRFRLGFLEIRRTSRSDSVEIVCRSQIRGSCVRGIVCRSREDARSARGIFVGIDPVRNSI